MKTSIKSMFELTITFTREEAINLKRLLGKESHSTYHEKGIDIEMAKKFDKLYNIINAECKETQL